MGTPRHCRMQPDAITTVEAVDDTPEGTYKTFLQRIGKALDAL